MDYQELKKKCESRNEHRLRFYIRYELVGRGIH